MAISDTVEAGLVALPLHAEVLERCRDDLKDIIIVTSDGTRVPRSVTPVLLPRRPREVPVEITRVNIVPGSWTDIVIDKSSKIPTTGIRFDIDARNFVRRMEIRGWDEDPETYVVRLDGLIADVTAPLPIKMVDVLHPSNTFRYLNVRIYEDGQGPLKIDRIICLGDNTDQGFLRKLPTRILENEYGVSKGKSLAVFDLGEKRFPLVALTMLTGSTEFAKKATLYGTSQIENATWTTIHDAIFFRIRRGISYGEHVTANVPPQLFRYFKLELAGDGPEVPIERIHCVGQAPLVVFQHNRGTKYDLYYGNPESIESSDDLKPERKNMPIFVLDTSEVVIEADEKNPSWRPRPQETGFQRNETVVTLVKLGAIIAVMGVLFTLFWLMLKKGSLARKR